MVSAFSCAPAIIKTTETYIEVALALIDATIASA